MFKTKYTVLLVVAIFFTMWLKAQISRGDMYYHSGEFARAIPCYERGLKKSDDAEAMEHLANCYRITKDYKKAEEWYSKTINKNPNCNPVVYYYYSMVLRNNGKTAEAKQQLQIFIGKDPGNPRAQAQIKAVEQMQAWLAQTPIYAVKNVASINSPESDISPVMLDDGLLFVSDRGEQDILYGENDPYHGRAFYAVYFSKKKSEQDDSMIFGKSSKLSHTINKDFHNGPASVTADGKYMAFNRVDRKIFLRNKHFINRPKIFFVTRNGNRWGTVTPFKYNSDAYSCSHPALSSDGNMLFFSSDMPGGLGGNDIWMCRKDGSEWGAPVNLGSEVNSTGNEAFPYLRKDGTLYFSSDGMPGFGGLDIFSANNDGGKWTNVTNQGAPLNGATDDFGISFNTEGTRGYFSSDRPGGAGDDDVYSFKVTAAFVSIRGHLLASKSSSDLVPNTTVELMTREGKVVRTTTTDAQGNFKFDNLASDQSYIVRLNENDPGINGKPKYYMSDEKGNLIRVTVLDEVGGRFTFQNLPANPGDPPQLLSDDDYITIAGNLLTDGDPPQPLANMNVKLKDDAGNVISTATTNAFGAFAFSHIPPDKNYVVTMDEAIDPSLVANTRVIITNKSGTEIMSVKPDAQGKFQFRILKEDQATLTAMSVEDVDLRMDMRGTLASGENGVNPMSNTTINIIDDKGQVIQSVKTDDKGRFDFINLPADKSFLVSVDDVKDPGILSFGKIYIKDEFGKVIKTLRITSGGKFEFRILPFDRTTLGSVYVDDPWLQVMQMKAKQKKDSLLIIENIYYNYNDWHILPAAEITLEKVAKVMQIDPNIVIEISSHTDARGSDAANLELSKKRAQAVVDYLVKRGIDKKRLVAVGYGESRLLNKCGNNVECSEDEHAKNRRTEFKINRK